MGYYEEAAYELEYERREDLWYYCLARTEMDEKKAKALYIQEAVKFLQKEAEVRTQERRHSKMIHEEKQKREQQEWQRNRDLINTAKNSAKSTNPYAWTVIATALSILFFGRPLISAAEGFFSHIWRWPAAMIHAVAAAVAAFAFFSYIRRTFIRYESLRYDDDDWQIILVLGIIASAYLLIFFIF